MSKRLLLASARVTAAEGYNHIGDLGIEAVAGVIDLGGNTGGLNGNPLQCLNVFCP